MFSLLPRVLLSDSHYFNYPLRLFWGLTEAGRKQPVNKRLESPALTRVFLHMYRNPVGHSATAGSLLCAASVCSHTVPLRLPHSMGIKEEGKNSPGHATEGVW